MECDVDSLSRVCGVVALLLLRGLQMSYEAFRDINIVDCLLSDRHPDKYSRMPRFNVYCKCQRRDVSYLMLRMILDSKLPLVSEGGRRRPWS